MRNNPKLDGKDLTTSSSELSPGVVMCVKKCVLARAKVVLMSLGCDDCWTQTGEGEEDMLQY